MALAPYFDRIYTAIGGHLSVSRDSLTNSLKDICVGIRCGAEPRASDVIIAELTTNLAARLYPRLNIVAPEPLCTSLKDLAVQINPNIELLPSAQSSTTVGIGARAAEGVLFPGAAGWVAYLDHEPRRRSGPTNPYACGAAACLACAELFRRIFVQSAPERDFSLSVLDFSESAGCSLEIPETTIGDIAFVGVGAIGNAAIWAFARHKEVMGRLALVDAEDLTLLNLQRYVLGTQSDVALPKVKVAQREFSKSSLTIEPYQMSLEEFAGISPTLSTICISIDNVEGRRSAQALLPRLIVNGWTGDQALGVSWHVFSDEAACLACLYHPRGPGLSATQQAAQALGLSEDRAAQLWVTRQPLSQEDIRTAAKTLGVDEAQLAPWQGKPLGELYTDVICGAAPLDVAGVGRLETVPLAHQSVLAGILMAAELVKRTNKELARLSQSENLVSWDNVLQPPPGIWRKPRAREVGCICGDQDYQRVYRNKWKRLLRQKRRPVRATLKKSSSV